MLGDVTVGAGDVMIEGGGRVVVIEDDIISADEVIIEALDDIIVGALIKTTLPTSSIELRADSDGDLKGGVWIQVDGALDSARDVGIWGSSLVATTGIASVDGLADVSVFVEGDPSNDQIIAGGDVQFASQPWAPVGSAMVIDGGVTSGGALAVTSAGLIDGDGLLTAAAVDLDASSGIGVAGPLQLAATNISADTAGGPIGLANTSAAAVEVTSLTTVGGDVTFDQTGGGDVTFTGTVSSGDGTTDGGNISLTANEELTIAGGATVSSASGSGGQLTIRGATVSGAVTVGAGDVSIEGGGDNTVIDIDVVGEDPTIITAPVDIIIRALVRTTSAESDIILRADSDGDGIGGVWIDTFGELDSARDVVIAGSDLSVTGVADSVLVSADAVDDQIVAAGNVTLEAQAAASAGDDMLVYGSITAGGTVTVDSVGAINGGGLISAAAVDLDADSGIGDSTAVQLSAATIAADTSHGAIDVGNSLGTQVTVTSLTTVGSDISFEQTGGGPITFVGTITSGDGTNDGGDILLAADDDLTVTSNATVSSAIGSGGRLTIGRASVSGTVIVGAGDITIDGGSQNVVIDIDIDSDETLEIEAPEDIIIGALLRTDSATADILLRADSDGDGSGGVWIQVDGALDSARDVGMWGSSLVATTGVTSVDALADVSVFVQGDGANDQIIAVQDIDVGWASAAPSGADVVLDGRLRSIGGTAQIAARGTVGGGGLVAAPTVDLDAVTGIGGAAPFAVTATSITADTGGGSVLINSLATGPVTVGSLATADGIIRFHQTGGRHLTVAGNVSSGVGAAVGGDIEIVSDANMMIDAPVSSAPGSGGVLTIAGVTLNVSPVVGDGNITLTGGGEDTIIATDQISGTTIVVDSPRDIIVRSLLQTTAVGADIVLTADTDGDGAGGVLIEGTGEVESSGDVRITGSDLFVTADAVDSIVVEADDVDPVGRNQVQSGGSVSLTGSTAALAPPDADIVINGRIESHGALDVTALHDIHQGTDGDLVSNGGAVHLTADAAEGDRGGVLEMADGAVIDAGSAAMMLVSDGDATLGRLITSYAGPGAAVWVNSGSGAILSAGAAGRLDIEAAGAASAVDLDAHSGIGSTGTIEVVGATIAADTTNGNVSLRSRASVPVTVDSLATGTGDIVFEHSDGQPVSINTARTASGNVTLSVDGNDLTISRAVIAGGAGDVDLTAATAGDVVLVGTVTAVGDTVTIDAADAIRGSGAVTAGELALRATTGIGSNTPLNTAVSTIAAANAFSGNVQILNSTGGLLTVGEVDGLSGVTNADPSRGGGDIVITNSSPLTVDAPVTNWAGGDIRLKATDNGGNDDHLTLNAPLLAMGGDAVIVLDAGTDLIINDSITNNSQGLVSSFASDVLASFEANSPATGQGMIQGTAGRNVHVNNDVLIASETGAITDVPPSLRGVELQTTADLQAQTNTAALSGSFGRTGEKSFFLTVDWGDGTVERLQSETPDSFQFMHVYEGSTFASIPVSLSLTDDANIAIGPDTVTVESSLDPIIFVQVDTSESENESEQDDAMAAYMMGLDLSEAESKRERAEVAEESRKTTTIETTTFEVETMQIDAASLAVRQVLLHVISPAGELVDVVPLQENVLDDLPELFEELPDGRYRIYVREAGEQRLRLLIDVDVREGRATDIVEQSTTSDPFDPDTQEDSQQDDVQQPEAINDAPDTAGIVHEADGQWFLPENNRHSQHADARVLTAVRIDNSDGDEHVLETDEASMRQPLAVGAGIVAYSLSRQGRRSGRRPSVFSKAARLCRRIRQDGLS